MEDGRRVMTDFVDHYNTVRLNCAIVYVTAPADKLQGREKQIFTERDAKQEAGREARRRKRGVSMGLKGFQLTTAAGNSISN